jgi:hypothetical protein
MDILEPILRFFFIIVISFERVGKEPLEMLRYFVTVHRVKTGVGMG